VAAAVAAAVRQVQVQLMEELEVNLAVVAAARPEMPMVVPMEPAARMAV
jgi:hypothetical protein